MVIPEHARMQDFFGLRSRQAHAPPADAEAERLQAEASRAESPPSGIPAGASFDLHLAARAAPFVLFFLVLTGCRADAAGAGAGSATPPVESASAAVFRLHSSVDQLARRVGRLDPEAYAIPAGLGCAAGCDVLRVKTIRFRPGEALCECGRVPPVRRWAKVPTPNRAARAQKAAELQAPVRPDGRVALNP